MTDPAWMSARELLGAYASRALSPVEALEAVAARIEALDGELRAFHALCLDRAREEARAAEAAWAAARPTGALCGVPLAVKDLFDTEGVPTACGARMLAGRVADADAASVRRVRAAGAVVIGKSATHEFAWGLTMVNEALGSTHNPWDPGRTPGGSSGGSAVALATGMAPLALGSDTGGSIRLPAAFCGVVGLKPTYGRVSLAGCWPLAPSLDHAGPMARTPDDAALLLGVLAPWRDSGSPDGLLIGVPGTHPVPLAPAVADAVAGAAAALEGAGARVTEVRLPDHSRLDDAFGTIFLSEALDTHRRAGLWPARREEYGFNVSQRLELAEQVTISEVVAALAERERLRAEALALFDGIDLVLTPVSAVGAPLLDEAGGLRDFVVPFTCPQDLLGLPTCSVRAGFDAEGVPVGVQLSGPPRSDGRVLAAARALFEATPEIQAPWPERAPR